MHPKQLAAGTLIRFHDRSSGYRVSHLLGEGGFGTIYQVEHEILHKRAAAKVSKITGPKAKLALNKALFAARLLSRMEHPNLPDVYDAGMMEGEPPRLAVIMQLLVGEELGDILKREGRLEIDRALRYAEAVAGAVAVVAVEGTGVIHRDIKPANVFIKEGDVPLVLDFDCARLPGSDTVSDTGGALGTPLYMSPEHWRHHRTLDSRTDVWALAVMLYQMVSGRLPFFGSTLPEVYASVREDIPVSLEHEVGADVWALIERGLRKDRDERYRDMADFAAHIQALRQRLGGAAYPPTQRLSADVLPPAVATIHADPAEIAIAHGASESHTERAYATATPTKSAPSAPFMAVAAVIAAIVAAGVVFVLATGGSDEGAPAVGTTDSATPAAATDAPTETAAEPEPGERSHPDPSAEPSADNDAPAPAAHEPPTSHPPTAVPTSSVPPAAVPTTAVPPAAVPPATVAPKAPPPPFKRPQPRPEPPPKALTF